MDYLFRLIRPFLILAMVLLAHSAFAAECTSTPAGFPVGYDYCRGHAPSETPVIVYCDPYGSNICRSTPQDLCPAISKIWEAGGQYGICRLVQGGDAFGITQTVKTSKACLPGELAWNDMCYPPKDPEPEPECTSGQSTDLKNKSTAMTLDDLKANGNRGCIGGCLVSISGANMAYQSINGTISKGVFGAGTATNTGAKCEGGSNSIGDKNPADGDMTYPQSQADCGANQKFTYVQGHGYCAHADAENPNQTEYCKQHQYEATCSEGGEEFCKANTKAYACIPGSERYCSLKPNSPSCAPGNADFCRQNPDHPSCVPGQPEYCSTHPDDSQCREKDVQDCVANPSLPKCTQVEHCSVNPSDPTCSAPTTAYCTQFKDDLKCKGSQFGGSCSAGFSCTGDAIQCAIAKQQHETICALTPSGADPIVQAGEKALAGQDPGMQYLPGGSKQGETMDFGFTMSGASATPLFGTASAECPAPRRVDLDIMGYQRSIEIPWIAVCRYAELVGPFVLIVATMIASFIAFGKR